MRSRKPNGVRQSATWPTATAASAISTPTCRSVPRTSRPSHDAAGRSGDWGKPEPGSPRSPCRTSLTIKSPTKVRSRVARTSWTPRLSRMPAASPAQAAPASTPPPSAQSVAIGRGAGTMWSATQVAARDRKSTRLNSSHSQISYAVFCLKKKKEAQLVVRVSPTEVFRNCPLYIHEYQLVKRSRFVPKAQCETRVPPCKQSDVTHHQLAET